MSNLMGQIRETVVRYKQHRNAPSPSRVEENLKYLRINKSGTLELDLDNEVVANKLIGDIQRMCEIDQICDQR